MKPQEDEKIQAVIEKLLINHMFSPTEKSHWVNELINEGFKEEEARHIFKAAATKYHISKFEERHKKINLNEKLKKVLQGSVAGIFTFIVGPWLYFIFVLVLIYILSLIL